MAAKSDLNSIPENSNPESDNNIISDDIKNIVITVDDNIPDTCQSLQNGGTKKEDGGLAVLEVPNALLSVPLDKNRHRMSIMEEESAKEKLRLALLKQCAAILKQGDQRYTKESLHRTFQDVVSTKLPSIKKITLFLGFRKNL